MNLRRDAKSATTTGVPCGGWQSAIERDDPKQYAALVKAFNKEREAALKASDKKSSSLSTPRPTKLPAASAVRRLVR